MARITRLLKIVDRMSRRTSISASKSSCLLEWSIHKIRLNRFAINCIKKTIYRGEIYWCDLGENIGCEENKRRPCVVVQNQTGNAFSPTTIVAPITNAVINLPIAVKLDSSTPVTGTIHLGQIRVVSKSRLKQRVGKLSNSQMKQVDLALMKSVGVYQHLIHEQTKYETKVKYINDLREKLKIAEDHINMLLQESQTNTVEDLIKKIHNLS